MKFAAVLLPLLSLALSAADGPGQLSPALMPLFNEGEAALQRNDLRAAEQAFRGVLEKDPRAVGAYANLGVIYMRQKQWDQALTEFRAAEKLAPSVPGIRLNIGLAYYRQSRFREAIPPLESVVRDLPSSDQAQYLLGLCEFFTDRYAEALPHLEAVWNKQSSNLAYLYAVIIAADKAGQTTLRDRATARMLEVGRDSAEVHLFMGKALSGRGEPAKAAVEFAKAAQINPRLPFVHYYLGLIARQENDLPRAKAEFLEEASIDPDVAFNYDELARICYLLQDYAAAEKYYRKAVELDKTLATAWYGLARVYQDTEKYPEALKAVDGALALDSKSASLHFLRGQVLLRLHREEQARRELAEGNRLEQQHQDEVGKQSRGETMRDPQAASAP
ncbi:MAG TPA: tetratricopeptide repeat protein [Bryobacteraceae bacterium]|nr:tetratricopeptide repeat protein [Bryobacteraceae bacterium]